MHPEQAIRDFAMQPLEALTGFSGGADSTALLLAMHKCGIRTTAVHFNHHLRGEASDGDERWCREFCRQRNIPFLAIDLQVREEQEAAESLESAARRLRLREWQRLTAEKKLPVFLAHHRDDALEELFLRLARGANCSGLTSLQAVRQMENGLTLCRPLLECRKCELEEYLRSEGICDWCIDATNAISDCRRNAVRNRLLPLFREIFDTDSGLLTALENLREDADFIEEQVPAVCSDVWDWQELSRPVLARALRSLLHLPVPPARRTIQRIHEAVQNFRVGDAPVEVPFGQGRIARIGGSGGIEILSTDEAAPTTDKWPEPVAQRFYWNRKPHELESADGRFFIFKQRKNAAPSRLMPHEFFDPEALPEYLTIDFWHPGDRMRTFGGQTKKLQDLFQERRIPREYRRYFPVIKAGDEIIWVPGVCRSPFGKVPPTGKSIRLACFYRGAPDILSP